MKRVLATLCLMITSAAYAEHPAQVAAPREPQWCLDHHSQLNAKAKQGGFDVMLLGDSITWEWEANEKTGKPVWPQLAPYKAATFGVSGDRTEHLLWRLQNGNLEIPDAPKSVVIMIGTNNLGQRNDPPQEVATAVGLILQTVKERYPKCAITLYGIFPRGNAPAVGIRKAVEETNLLLLETAKKHEAAFIDLAPAFLLPDGTLNPDHFRDGVHLSREGYQVWAESLRDALSKL